MSLLDLKDSFYRKLGYTGSVQDMEYQNLADLTGVRQSLQDMLSIYLKELGFTGALQDQLYTYLGSLGYTGALQDRIVSSLKDGTYLSGAFDDTTLYLRFDTQYYNTSDWLCTFVPDAGTEDGTTLFAAFIGDYYTTSDIYCGDLFNLLADFTVEQYVVKDICL